MTILLDACTVFLASIIDFTLPHHILCSLQCFGFGLDSDPGRKKLSTTTRMEKSEKFSCVEELDDSSLKVLHMFFHLWNFSVFVHQKLAMDPDSMDMNP
jgi:hypothetical protein